MIIVRDELLIYKDGDDLLPFVAIKNITGTEATKRKRARKLLLDLGLPKFRFKEEPFQRYLYFGETIFDAFCISFDFVNKNDRKKLKDFR